LWFDKTRHEGVRVLGPTAAPILKSKSDYGCHFVVKSLSRAEFGGVVWQP